MQLMITISILEFLFFSIVGGILDLFYNVATERKWSNTGYFGWPFCPIYGLGAIILIFVCKYFSFLPLWLLLALGSLAMIVVEYLGGIFTEKYLKVKLWDYSNSRFHLGGYIDALHSFYWIILVNLFYFFLFPVLIRLEKIIFIPDYVELPAFILFVIACVWLTARKNPYQFLVIKGKVMNLTLEKYRRLYSNINQLYQTTSVERKKQLQKIIHAQLQHTGAYLKKVRWSSRYLHK